MGLIFGDYFLVHGHRPNDERRKLRCPVCIAGDPENEYTPKWVQGTKVKDEFRARKERREARQANKAKLDNELAQVIATKQRVTATKREMELQRKLDDRAEWMKRVDDIMKPNPLDLDPVKD